MNNFQPLIGETIVQGGQNKSPGGQSTPWLPLISAYERVTVLSNYFTQFLVIQNYMCAVLHINVIIGNEYYSELCLFMNTFLLFAVTC